MILMLWRVGQYIKHQFHCRHRKGRGIHSPYLFEFVHDVVFNAGRIRVPSEIAAIHQELRTNSTIIPSDTRGARSSVERNPVISVGSFVRRSSVSPKYGALLYRITQWFKPTEIIELGTGLGVSTLYLASGSHGVPLASFEGNMEKAAFAAQLFNRNQLEGISIHWGDLEQGLDEILTNLKAIQTKPEGRFLAFVDANHRFEPTIRYVKSLISRAGEETIIIMDDIYWSSGMYRAWREVTSWPEVRMSIDLFHMGILLLRKDLQKLDLKINF